MSQHDSDQKPARQKFLRESIHAGPEMPFFQIDPNARRLHWNENPFDYPSDLKEIVLSRIAQKPWAHYPLGFRAYDLMHALAAQFHIDPDMIIIGNGSSDLLKIVLGAALGPGDAMIVPTPMFYLYKELAEMFGAKTHEITLEAADNFKLPVDAIVQKADQTSAKVIAICAPNNPTGTVYPPEVLAKIAAQTNALLVIDAAYGEFSGQNLLPLVQQHDNVVTIHTFSKAFAMAGVRVGYAIADPSIARDLEKLVTNFTLSLFSETAALVALENYERFAANIQRVIQERERVAGELAKLPGVHVYPSGANFILFEIDRPPAGAVEYLHNEHSILISDTAIYPTLPNYLRISIGSKEDNNAALDGLRAYLNAG